VSLFASGRLPQTILRENALRENALRENALRENARPADNPNHILARTEPLPAGRTAPPQAPQGAVQPPVSARQYAANPFGGIGLFFLSGFLFFLFSRVLDFKLASLHLPLIFSCICLALSAVNGLRRAWSMRAFQFLVGLTIWMILCTPFSVWKGGSVEMLKESWSKSLSAGFIVAALVQTSGHALRIMKVLAFAFLAAGLLGIFFGESQEGRLMLSEGSYSNPNDYAIAILYGCVSWYFMMQNPRSPLVMRVCSFFVLLFLGVILLKTGSRGALITAVITFIPAFWRLSAITKLAVGLALPAALVGILAILPPEMRNRYTTFFSDANIQRAKSVDEQEMLLKAQGSSEQRLQLAKDALRLTLQNPLFGVGPGMFAVAQNDLNVERSNRKGAWIGTHNSYLQVSSETGIPGFLLFLGCLLTCWRDLRKLQEATRLRRDARAQEIQVLAFTMRLLMISSFVFFLFEHIPFSPFVPVLTCWIAAFSQAATEELSLQKFQSAERAAPAGGLRPVWAR
jgi:O-antigen ligase